MRLTLTCSRYKVDVDEGDAFLGLGAYGCVFKVTCKNINEQCALKIVGKDGIKSLNTKMAALNCAKHTGLTTVVVGNLIETFDYAALLLSPVGMPLPRPKSQQDILHLFD